MNKVLMKEIQVHSQYSFDALMDEMGWNDSNIEEQKNVAIISICQDRFLEFKETTHWFKQNHSNVLNLDFYDLEMDIVDKDGKVFKAITPEQADEIISFIHKNLDKNYLIHCTAGVSRSGSVGRFIVDHFDWADRERFDKTYNWIIVPNPRVTRELKRAFNQFYYNINNYEDIWS